VIPGTPRPLVVPPAFPWGARAGRRHRRRPAPGWSAGAPVGFWARLADDRQAIGLKLALLLACLLLASWLEVPM
jgi:hypothetical protein